MRRLILLLGIVLAARGALAAEPNVLLPFEDDTAFIPENKVDVAVLTELRKRGIEPAHRCSDAVFLRRVYVDVLGRIPEPSEVRRFLIDDRPDKRALLVDAVLARPEYADYASLRWCDVLRVKSEFPINLWPNAVQAYHRWVHDALRENRPFDQFARDLLTSSGSNFRVPPVNFYRAMQTRTPTAIAGAVSLTFLGTRIGSWPEDRRAGLKALFSRVAYKRTAEWKEEIVLLDPAPAGPLEAVLPDGSTARVGPDEDPRRAFADWLIRPENPWFAKVVVNRIWNWLLGRGVVHEPDDFRPDNPPAIPDLLRVLEEELVASGWDLKKVYRLILTSRTYQQSPVARAKGPEADVYFAHYIVRRLDAEVLADVLAWLGSDPEEYSSIIPEPFTYLPKDQRSVLIADGSITSAFLEMFGRPSRDTGLDSERNNQPTDAQRLFLLNSTDVQRKIERGRRLRVAMTLTANNRREMTRWMYLGILSREPTAAEADAAARHFEASGVSAKEAADDLAWALINSKEFLYRH